MAYDWRQEQEEANRRRQRDAEIEAQRQAHNRKLEENARREAELGEIKFENDRKAHQKAYEELHGSDMSSKGGWPASVLLLIAIVVTIVTMLARG